MLVFQSFALLPIDGSAAFVSPQVLRVGLLQLFKTSAALWQLHNGAKVAMPMFKIVHTSVCLPLIHFNSKVIINCMVQAVQAASNLQAPAFLEFYR